MTDLDFLKKLVRENGYLYTKDVTSAGIRREQLKKYLDEGSLIRESRGIYSFADSINDEFVLLQIRCKKGVFSYGTALYFHGLSDRFPQMVSMTVPKTYNVFYLKEELKEYFASKERDNIRLMEYARKFHIEEKVQEYMEIL